MTEAAGAISRPRLNAGGIHAVQLIAPDLLRAAAPLSAGAAGALVMVGLLLWSAGWQYHRFWVVFAVTLAAGIVGLKIGRAAPGQQALVVGVLVAVSAGVMALELAKLLAFFTGGAAAWVAVQAVFPQAQELWAVFLSGGLVGVVLSRLWTMLVTSLVGVWVAGHAALVLAAPWLGGGSSAFAARHPAELNGAAIALTLLGVVAQVRTAKWLGGEKPAAEEPADQPVLAALVREAQAGVARRAA